MELFVINRHGTNEQQIQVNEQENIARVLKKIEKNKKNRLRQKEKEKEKKAAIAHTLEKRQKKREHKAKHVPVPQEQNKFLDENITREVVQNDVHHSENLQKQSKPKKNTNAVEGFTVLGGEQFNTKTKVKRVLPKWLSNPTIISVDLQNLQTKVSSLVHLDDDLKAKLKDNRIKYLFPVQAAVIPWLLQANKDSNYIIPRDVCVSAPTGSGKTLAFVLPIVQALKFYEVKRIRALVILPTQDLALQVYEAFRKYAASTTVNVGIVTGRAAFEVEKKQLVIENEAFGYYTKIDILICTPGRLVDHLKDTNGFDLRQLRYLVIDEADRVLDNVQNDWLYHLEKHLYSNEPNNQPSKILNLLTLKVRQPQKLLFSATLSQDPEKLQKLSLFQPKLFTSVVDTGTVDNEVTDTFVGKYTTPKELTEKYIICSLQLRPLVLYEFIQKQSLTKTIIFTHTTENAHRLTILLQSLFKEKLKIAEVSSQLDRIHRVQLLTDFSNGNIDIIVCTDRLTRGMDFAGVKCVISYAIPKYIKTYIHRAGRTARAGEQGLAVTLLDKSQLGKFMALLQQAGKNNLEKIQISEEGLEELGEKYKEALQELKNAVSKEEEDKIQKIKTIKIRGQKRKHNIQSKGK